jgi:hypothetical protein
MITAKPAAKIDIYGPVHRIGMTAHVNEHHNGPPQAAMLQSAGYA